MFLTGYSVVISLFCTLRIFNNQFLYLKKQAVKNCLFLLRHFIKNQFTSHALYGEPVLA